MPFVLRCWVSPNQVFSNHQIHFLKSLSAFLNQCIISYFFILFSLYQCIILSLSVLKILSILYLGENGIQYGKQRLWGSVGWGLFAIISGVVLDKFTTDHKTNYAPAFYIMLALITCDVICSCTLKVIVKLK